MVWGEMCHSSGRCYLLSWSWYQPWLPRPRASVSSSQWSHSSPLMAHITSHITSPASHWSAWPQPGFWLADSPGCCSHLATQRGLTPNCKLRFLGVGRLGTLEMGSPLSQTEPQTLMDSCILILRGMWGEASDYQHSWISTQEANVCEILSPLCYSLDCDNCLLSSGCKCQTTNNILLCFDKSVCQAGGEREETGVTWDLGCGQARSERE